MKKLLLAISICAAAVAYAQDNAAVAAPQNTGAAATQQAATVQAQEKSAESLADLNFGAKALDRFSAAVSVAYESEYNFRGVHNAGASIQPQVDLGYDFGAGFAAYFGYWGTYEIENNDNRFNESDIYFGATYTVANFTFDVGAICYMYPEDARQAAVYDGHDAEWEWKAAISYDTTDLLGDFNVSPSIAYYYNYTLDVNTLELGLFYSAPVMKWINGDNWLTLDSSVVYGYICAYGGANRDAGDYSYFQIKSDVVVSITDYCSWSFGLRYSLASHNASEDGRYNPSQIWFGTGMSFGF